MAILVFVLTLAQVPPGSATAAWALLGRLAQASKTSTPAARIFLEPVRISKPFIGIWLEPNLRVGVKEWGLAGEGWQFSVKVSVKVSVRVSVQVSPTRIERVAYRLGGGRSIRLSYGDLVKV